MSYPNQNEVIQYLHDNYYDDCERMAHIQMIGAIANSKDVIKGIPSLIDKVALFNSIKKTYPPPKPEKTIGKKIIEGIGFILYGA